MTITQDAAAASLWRNRNYNLVFFSSIFAGFSNGIAALALPWLATLLSRDPFMVSLVAASVRLPWLLFTLPAGVLTDRADRKRLIAWADVTRAILSVAIMLLALDIGRAGENAIWLLCLFGLLFGTAEVIRENAAMTIVPSIVAREDFERANGTMWSASQISGQFIGPPLAGLLIGWGIALPFGFDAASFAVSAALVWCMTLPRRQRPRPQPFREALREGIVWLWRSRQLFKLAVSVGVLNFFFMANFTILVLYSQEVLGLSAFGHGLLMTAAAAGGVLGSLFGARVQRRLGLHGSMVATLAGTALSYAALGGSASLWVAVPALFFEMFNRLVWSIVTVSFRQRHIPDAILGRINSLYRFLSWGTMPLGAMAGGWLVSTFEPVAGRQTALHLPYAMGCIAVALLALYCHKALKLSPDGRSAV